MEFLFGLAWVMFAALLGRARGMHKRERILGREQRRATWAYALLVALPVIVLAGMRSRYFADTHAYTRNYLSIPTDLYGKWRYATVTNTKDQAFYFLGALLSVFFGKNYRLYLMTLALIQGHCLMKTYRKYSEDYWFAIFVFVASTDIYSWMYNGIRQFTAATIVFAASDWIFGRKYIKACLAIVFASLFHQSALLMIPVVFVVQGKPWNWKTLLVILGAVVAMSFTGAFTDILGSALEETQYRNVVSDWQMSEDDGTNPIRVLVYSVPTILSLFCRKKIQRSGDRVVQVACNMGIVSTALYLVSMATSGILLGRLPIYCSLYANGILLPWELKHVFGRPIRLAAILFYLVFFYFQMHFTWGYI